MDTDSDVAPAPEYEFDMDANESNTYWPDNNRSTASTMVRNNNEDMSFHSTPSDVNNVTDVNNNFGDVNHINLNHIRDSEYSYHAFEKIQNYYAGPSYWKVPPNRRLVQIGEVAKRRRPRKKRQPEKVIFSSSLLDENDDNSSDDELLISVTSKLVTKIRKFNYRNHDPKKINLPPFLNIPRDLFHSYEYCPSFDIQHTRPFVETQNRQSNRFVQNAELNNVQENHVEDDDAVSKLSISFKTFAH